MSQNKSLLVLATGLSLFFAGCEGTGPNTQNGAVAGGVLGAIAGGIIGNNSGGHNGLGGALIGGAIGAMAGGAIGNQKDHEQGTIYTSENQATTTVVVAQPPPPPPMPPETPSQQPSPDAYWVPGHYNWNGQQYVWVAGYWTIPPNSITNTLKRIGSIAVTVVTFTFAVIGAKAPELPELAQRSRARLNAGA